MMMMIAAFYGDKFDLTCEDAELRCRKAVDGSPEAA
jgi:hypothetical protein